MTRHGATRTSTGRPWRFAPRVILKEVVAQAAAAGFTVYVGVEVEYFLLKRDETGALAPADSADTASQPCYDARGVTRMYDHLAAISTAMNTLGWGNYANDHEDGNGQFEQNFEHADALTTADRVITLRYLLSVLAHERGMIATFMPSRSATAPARGCTCTCRSAAPSPTPRCSPAQRTTLMSGRCVHRFNPELGRRRCVNRGG
jgi:glutamine synthetase